MVLAAFLIRLGVVAFLYPERLNPDRDHWRFAGETGRIARFIVQGHGFGSPLHADTGNRLDDARLSFPAGSCLQCPRGLHQGFGDLHARYIEAEPLDPPNIFLCTLTILALIGLRRAFRGNFNLAAPFAIALFFASLRFTISPTPRTISGPSIRSLWCLRLTRW